MPTSLVWESYRQCALARPTISAHLWLGRSLLILDRPDEAATAFGKAVSLRPQDYEANLGRGVTLLRLPGFEEATSSLERALESKPGARSVRWGLLASYLATGKLNKVPGLHLGINCGALLSVMHHSTRSV
jgi:Flp pilus assembly protein TadD